MLLLLLATLTAAPTLLNPGFEDGAAGWDLAAGFTVDTTLAHSGQASLRYENTDAKLYRLSKQRFVPIPGARYEFSAWVKTAGVAGADSGAAACFEWGGVDGWLGGAYPAGLKGDSDWTLIRGVTPPLPADVVYAGVTLYLRRGMTGTAWFDDLSVDQYYGPPWSLTMLSPSYRGRFPAGSKEATAKLRITLAERLKGGQMPSQLQFRLGLKTAGGDDAGQPLELDPTGRETTAELRLRELPAGTYSLRGTLLDKASGDVLGSVERELTAYTAGDTPPTVYLDEQGRTIVQGQPFFPLGLYDSRSDAEGLQQLAAGGFNCIMPYGINSGFPDRVKEYLDAADGCGLKVIYSLKDLYDGTRWRPRQIGSWTAAADMAKGVVEAFRSHPAVLAWYLNDELPTTFVPALTERYQLLRQLDPNHPCWSVLYQVKELDQYVGTTDILGTDPYPVPTGPLSRAGEWTRLAGEAMGRPVGTWMVPQAHDWGNYRDAAEEKAKTRAPTLDELRNMTYECLAAGAMGLVYYSYFDLQRDRLGFAPRWADMTALAAEVNALAPYLLSGSPRPQLALQPSHPDEVYAAAWRLGQEVLVVAANGSGETPGTVTWQLPDGARPQLKFGVAEQVGADAVVLSPGQAVALTFTMP